MLMSYFTFFWNSGVFCTYSTCTIQLKLVTFQVLKSHTWTALLSGSQTYDLWTHVLPGIARVNTEPAAAMEPVGVVSISSAEHAGSCSPHSVRGVRWEL